MKSLLLSLKREPIALLLAGAMAFGIGLSTSELVTEPYLRPSQSGCLETACTSDGDCTGYGANCTCSEHNGQEGVCSSVAS
jgi:hypothetical protein